MLYYTKEEVVKLIQNQEDLFNSDVQIITCVGYKQSYIHNSINMFKSAKFKGRIFPKISQRRNVINE